MLTIWGRLNSHNVKKVAWFAQELGIEHVRHDIGGQFGYTDAYLAKNPNAMVPSIDDDGFFLWESNTILRYLAARHGGDRFWPADPRARAGAEKWMDWQADFAEAQRPAFINCVRRAPHERDPDAIASSTAAVAKKMAILDAALAHEPWLSGSAFGIGDVPMGVYAHTYFTIAIERPDLPHLSAWYTRLQQRPGYASQVMIPLT